MKTQNTKILSRLLALAAVGLSLSPIHQAKAAGFVDVSPMNKGRCSSPEERTPPPPPLLSRAELYAPDERVLTLLRSADGAVSLAWTGLGALEQTSSLTTPNWQAAGSQAN